jgi:hypothetical protein
VGERFVIGLVLELAGIDSQRPTAAMVTPPQRRIIRQSPNMTRDKSMSIKLDDNVVFNTLALG